MHKSGASECRYIVLTWLLWPMWPTFSTGIFVSHGGCIRVSLIGAMCVGKSDERSVGVASFK